MHSDQHAPENRRSQMPDGILAKVRALLAKAEATTFEAEAEAFTAKAQQWMARYRIDRALLDALEDGGDGPRARVLRIAPPYGRAKALLLSEVAAANGCRVVWSDARSEATLFGFPDELEAVDALFTSLLVQVTGALAREGSKRDASGRSRTTRFRRSFLVAFARRIGDRLHDAVASTVDAASTGSSVAVVPLLERRQQATTEAMQAAFPVTGALRPTATDGEGWRAGTRFGDQADLGHLGRLPGP